MATSVGDIALNLKLNKQPYEKGLTEAQSSAGTIGAGIGKKLAVGIAGALGAVVATAGLKSLISSTAQLGDAIDKTSQKMGMTSKAYQEWGYIMERCGTSIDSMTMGMKTLASSAETNKDAFAQLGISQAEIASLDQEQLFSRTISALQGVEDTTKRTYLAGQLLGRGATELGAVLNMSASETEYLRQNLTALGGMMSEQAVANSAQYTDALTDIKMAFRGISNTVAEYVLPIVTSAINGYIIPAIQKACAVIRFFASLWNSVFGSIKKNTKAVGKGFKSAFGKNTTKAIGNTNKGIGGTGKSAKKAKKAVKELARELMGFDKINKLAKKTSADSGGGAGGGGAGGGAGGVGDLADLDAGLDGTNKKLFDFSKITEKLSPIIKALGGVFRAFLHLIKVVGKGLKPIGEFIWKHLIKPFGKLLGMAIVAVLDGIAGAIELVADFFEKHPKLGNIIVGIGLALLVLTKGAMGAGIIGKLVGLFSKLGAVIMAHPIAILITAIALAIGYIYKNWDKIKKTKFGKFLIKIGNALKTVGSAIKEKALKAFNKLKPVLSIVGRVIKRLAGIYIKSLIVRFNLLKEGVKRAWNILKKIGGYLSGKFKKAVEKVSNLVKSFKNAWGGIKSKTVELTGKVGEVAGDIFEGVQDATATVTVGLKDNFSSAWNAIKGAWEGIKDKTAEAITSLKDTFADAWGKIKDTWGAVKDKTASVTTKLADSFGSAWDKIKGAWGTASSKTATVTTKLSDSFSNAWKNIKDKWNAVKSKTATLTVNIKATLAKGWNGLVKKLRNAKLPLIKKFGNKLPLLAQGGWVDKNTPQLAVVGDNRHESEIVAPDSKLMAMARQASQEAVRNGSNAQVVSLLSQLLVAVRGLDTSVYLDGKQIAQNTVKNINQQTRTTGKFPLIV